MKSYDHAGDLSASMHWRIEYEGGTWPGLGFGFGFGFGLGLGLGGGTVKG